MKNKKIISFDKMMKKVSDLVENDLKEKKIYYERNGTIFNKEPYEEKFRSNKPINYKSPKFNTLRAFAGSRTRGIGICDDNGWWRKLTPIECERLQTVPDNYTDCVSDSQRYQMLGNGWTVDVIAEIFRYLNSAKTK